MTTQSLQSQFSDRLLTLSDGRPGLRGGIHVGIRTPGRDAVPGVPDPSATLDFISSDETLDRYGEIISAAGWKLDNYIRNPVFQNAHQYGNIIFTLGRALITEVRQVAGRQALFQRIQFAVNANPMSRIAHRLYSDGYLHTVSVGFIPIRWEDGPQSSSSSFSSSSSVPFRRRFLEQELLEVSAVSIPANPNALALALKSGAVEKTDLRDLSDLLRQTLAAPLAQPPADESLSLAQPTAERFPSPSGEGQGEGNSPRPQLLLALLRTLRDQLRHL
jgi:hypothetical protein